MNKATEKTWLPSGEYRLGLTPFGETVLQRMYTTTYVDRIEYWDSDGQHGNGFFRTNHSKGDIKNRRTKTETGWRNLKTIQLSASSAKPDVQESK